MAKKSGISAADMEALFGHALIQPKAKTGEGQAETQAARDLGVTILGSVAGSPTALKSWRAHAPDGKTWAMVTLPSAVTPSERKHFAAALSALSAAGGSIRGVLPVRKRAEDNASFLTDLLTTGTAADLSALKWPLARRLEFLAEVARGLEALHAAGLTHGCLCAANILLDDDLKPVLSEAGLVNVSALLARREAGPYEAYVAPEIRSGEAPKPAGDLYAVGKLLGELGANGAEKVGPELAEIMNRCLSPPMGRYASAQELAAALEHAAVAQHEREQMRGRMSEPRPVQPEARQSRSERVEPHTGAPAADFARAPSAPWVAPVGLGFSGLLLLVSALVAGALLGGTNTTLRQLLSVAVPLGAALATTLAPPLPRAAVLARVTLGAGLAALMVFAQPLAFAFRFAAQRQLRGSEASRARAIDDILRLGRDFRGMSLAGADLSNRDLVGADLRGVNLMGANLTGARAMFAEVDGANFDGSQLQGASLAGTQLQLATLGGAQCDGATTLPASFTCDGRQVVRAQPAPSH
jgi:hypothetical protein